MIALPDLSHLDALVDLLRNRRIVALVGAGCSTESGIPDYRGPESSRKRRTPIQYQEFVRSESSRARYWARSTVGWRRIATARPNAAHFALAQLEAAGAMAGVITQNVDGLHHAAGSQRVVELHGSLAAVRCLECGDRIERDAFQRRILELNGEWTRQLDPVEHEAAPDGDVDLPASALADFRVPACDACGHGVLKPDVVFFGENVPRPRLDEAWSVFNDANVLLVIGSSLTVYSGRRFVYRAGEIGMPIAVMNVGPTRADDVAAVKLDAPLGAALPAVAALLAREPAR
ncbi:MAG TPA: NAD-dependent protein deacetylase [Gemmatimonadaceae bacterium]